MNSMLKIHKALVSAGGCYIEGCKSMVDSMVNFRMAWLEAEEAVFSLLGLEEED